MKKPELLRGRSIEVKIEILQEAAGRAVGSGNAEDSVTISMVKAGSDMFMPEEVEVEQRVVKLE